MQTTHVERLLGPLRHDARNALGSVGLIVDLLALRGTVPEVDILGREIRRLSLMIEDLCELTHTTHGSYEIAPAPVALADIVDRAVTATAPYRGQTGAALAIDVPDTLRVVADPPSLTLALASILRHVAMPSQRNTLRATHAADVVELHVDFRGEMSLRLLGFARDLLALQGGSLELGEDLRVRLPAAAFG